MSDARLPHLPLRGFLPMFGWGLRLTCRGRRLLLIGVPTVLITAFVAITYIGADHGDRPVDRTLDLWLLLDEGMLGYIVPLIALLTVASGLRVEIGRKTMVYHLVRPVSRTTMFLARFASGVLPAWGLGTLALVVACGCSGVAVPFSVWLSLPVTALVTAIAVGAFYYVVTTLFRGGMIVALIYTFVFELLFAGTRGAMQKLSIMFHVRGVHHGLTDDAFVEKSKLVADALEPVKEGSPVEWINVSALLSLQERIAYDAPETAFYSCLGIALGLLTYGAWRINRRDFPLKD